MICIWLFIDSSPKLTISKSDELTSDETLNDVDDFGSSTQLEEPAKESYWEDNSSQEPSNLWSLKTLTMLCRLFFLLTFSCKVKIIRHMVQMQFSVSFKDCHFVTTACSVVQTVYNFICKKHMKLSSSMHICWNKSKFCYLGTFCVNNLFSQKVFFVF